MMNVPDHLFEKRLLSCFVLMGNTPQFVIQMKSGLHKTFSIFQDWSPELINDVHVPACACVHAQRMKTCMQLWAENIPSYFS